MAGILVIVGLIVSLIGWILIVVHAWKESSAHWGILCLIFSPVCLIYFILNFRETWKYMAMNVGGGILYGIGAAMAAGAAAAY